MKAIKGALSLFNRINEQRIRDGKPPHSLVPKGSAVVWKRDLLGHSLPFRGKKYASLKRLTMEEIARYRRALNVKT